MKKLLILSFFSCKMSKYHIDVTGCYRDGTGVIGFPDFSKEEERVSVSWHNEKIDDTRYSQNTPVRVPIEERIGTVSCGENHTVAQTLGSEGILQTQDKSKSCSKSKLICSKVETRTVCVTYILCMNLVYP